MMEPLQADPAPIAAVNCTLAEFNDARSVFGIARHWAQQHQQAEGYIIIGPDSPLGIGYFVRVARGSAAPSSWRECCPQAFATHLARLARQMPHKQPAYRP